MVNVYRSKDGPFLSNLALACSHQNQTWLLAQENRRPEKMRKIITSEYR